MSGKLTVRAKNGGPPRDAAAFQRGPTLKAGLAGTAVHPESVLKSPGVAPRRAVIPDGTAARVNGFEQDFPQGRVKLFQAVGGHELRVGPDARAEQAFVRVNIPAPRQHGLIKAQRLDLAPPPGKTSREGIGVHLQRLRAKAVPERPAGITDYSGQISDAGVLVPGVGTMFGFGDDKWTEPGTVFVTMKVGAITKAAETGKQYSIFLNVTIVNTTGEIEKKIQCNIIARDETGQVLAAQLLEVPATTQPNTEVSLNLSVESDPAEKSMFLSVKWR